MFFFWFFRPNEHYVFLGYSNGVLRLHKIISPKFDPKIKRPFLNWTLEDYWHIHLHDPSNGAIREIFPIDTIKGHLILTCAQDGSLLVHEIGKVETVQDFLIKLGIKPLMHLLEISTFSLNNVIVRLTKIMNRADKNWAHF